MGASRGHFEVFCFGKGHSLKNNRGGGGGTYPSKSPHTVFNYQKIAFFVDQKNRELGLRNSESVRKAVLIDILDFVK